jgi:glutathione peroxidase
MFSKLVTKAGPDQSPIYALLGKDRELPSWNFAKYVVGKDGRVVAFFNSKVPPDDKALREAIEAELAR